MRWPNQNPLRERADCPSSASHVFLAGWRVLGARVWSLAKTGKSASSMETGVWASRLNEEKDFLLSLVRGIEAEFLTTGGGLMVLARQLSDIQKECQSLTDLTLGRSQDAAVQFAFQLLKKAEDLVLASYEQYDHVFATFHELQQRLTQLSRQHNDLMRVLLPLNFITMSFRIEASRHPLEVQQAFFTLADNVNRTVDEVRNAMEQQFTELAVSERIACSLMEKIYTSIQQHRKEVAVKLTMSRNQLHVLNEALTSSGAGTNQLADLNQAVNRHINGIVMAQQCQDITRQRIEHVGEAMEEMRAHLDGSRTIVSVTEVETRQFVYHAGQIQLHQVQNVFDQLNHAANGLKSGIQSLRTEAGAAAEVAVKMGGAALDTNVASQCQAGITDILAIVSQAVQKIAEIIAAFAPLQASFVDCTGKATALASDVRHAGLNAQIFAIHAPDGATLEVLAGRVRTISEDVIELVGQMGDSLNHTTEMVNNLRQRLEDFQIMGESEQAVLAVESELSQKKLSELASAIPRLIRRVTQQQGTFAQSVESVLAQVRFPATVAEASVRSTGFFRDLVASGSEGARFSVESAAAQKIDLLHSKYTMESERRTHAAAFQPALVAAGAGATASEPALELFDDFSSPAPAPVATEASGVTAPPNVRSELQPRLGDLPLRETTLQVPALLPAENIPAASENLGDNVELF
jgi:hypothetical protein